MVAVMRPLAPEPQAHPRIDAIDRVKACAILAVIITHAGPAQWSPHITGTDEWLRYAWTAFHVPAFLMMAGTLYRTTGPMPWGTVARRLQRVLVPYLVVLTSLYVTGIAPLPVLREVPFAIATGASYGIYYFVPVFACCVLLGWALSRCAPRTVTGITAALTVYALAAYLVPAMRPKAVFWQFRDPLGCFYLGYFALGWLGVPKCLAVRAPTWLLGAIVLALVLIWTRVGFPVPVPLRMLYAVTVVSMLWAIPFRFPGMRFLSEATLGLYLLHRPMQDLLTPLVASWQPAARIAVLVGGSLAGASLFCVAARRVLGAFRARAWLGV